ncbi:glycosyltransferase [Bosea sp. UNC402CLCol]|uniref:glycosyltransferase n=1 Tax=Bosea sp. UNC402CLCol TaxID=1510531 RepID=UPI0012E0199F|nr:glycosyltransferase [Bosea sp. UNC402CLCol]
MEPSSEKSVCFILDHLGVGGVQEFILNFCKFMRGKNRVTVVSIFGNDIYSDRLRAAGAEVVMLTDRRYSYAAVLDPRSFSAFFSFYRANASRFDRIHLKLFATFAYASLMGEWRSPKVSAGLDCNRSQLPFPIQALFWIFGRFYRRFYLSKLLWSDYSAFGLRPDQLLDQQYPVTERSSNTPRHYPASFAFLSVGRGIPQKGHAEAVALFMELKRRLNGDVSLTIIGEGPAIDALKERYPPGQGEMISFPGSVDDYDDWLIGATGIIRMAFGEDTNSVIREGVLAGKVVATTLEGPGCRDLAEKGLVIAIDREDLAGSAARLAEAATTSTESKREYLKRSALLIWHDDEAYKMYD